jgi:hypothetical protein
MTFGMMLLKKAIKKSKEMILPLGIFNTHLADLDSLAQGQ